MSEKEIVQAVSDMIGKAFIEAKICGACMPASLLLWEIMRTRDIKLDLKLGTLKGYEKDRHIESPPIFHVWNEFEGTVYDPTRTIFRHFQPGNYEFTYHPDQKPQGNPDSDPVMEIMMSHVYIQAKCMGDTTKYWSAAPSNILAIRKKVFKKAKKLKIN